MTDFDNFIRKWGGVAPLISLPDGTKRVAHKGDDPLLLLMAQELEAITGFDRTAKRHPYFHKDLKVDTSNARNWNIADDILQSTSLNGGTLTKFCWNPITAEFLFVWPGQDHASAIQGADFDDYVRGIVLPSQNLVTFRPFYPTWVQKRADWYDQEDLYDINYDAQEAAEEALKSHGAKGWTFRQNISNAQLSEMTGQYQW